MDWITDFFSKIPLDNETVRAWGPVAIGGITACVGFIGLWLSFRYQSRQLRFSQEKDEKDRNDAKTKAEIESLEKMIQEFYSPMRSLRSESLALYQLFATKEQAECKKENAAFRTIVYLANGHEFSAVDKKILEEIVRVGGEQQKLIEKYSSSLHDSSLTELLGRLACHISVLKLAAAGNIRGMGEKAKEAVFPLEIDGALDSAVMRSRARINRLHGTFGGFSLQGADVGTTKYYNANSADYFKRTIGLSNSSGMKAAYDEFRALMRRGGRILDAGCGVGRDTRYFIQRGYRVVSFDAAQAMVDITNQYPFANCEHRSFFDVTEHEEYDGVWACASLLHIERKDFPDALRCLSTALRDGGVLYFSVKGGAQGEREGRRFEYYTKNELEDVLKEIPCLIFCKYWENAGEMSGDTSSFHNFILKKTIFPASSLG